MTATATGRSAARLHHDSGEAKVTAASGTDRGRRSARGRAEGSRRNSMRNRDHRERHARLSETWRRSMRETHALAIPEDEAPARVAARGA